MLVWLFPNSNRSNLWDCSNLLSTAALLQASDRQPRIGEPTKYFVRVSSDPCTVALFSGKEEQQSKINICV